MIRASSIVFLYLLGALLPLHVPALPGAGLSKDGCGCSTTISECCCAAPYKPANDGPGWKTCPRKRDTDSALPTLPNHLVPVAEAAEPASPELPQPATIALPENPLPDSPDVIPIAR
ncbi:MAG: hypothetical protein ACI8W8_003166 [Rhodothermales bacterium]|jgi:hypothetical protein